MIRMNTLPPTIFTQVFLPRFRIFFLVMFEKKTGDNPEYMYLVRRVKVRVEHKNSYFRDESEKKEK